MLIADGDWVSLYEQMHIDLKEACKTLAHPLIHAMIADSDVGELVLWQEGQQIDHVLHGYFDDDTEQHAGVAARWLSRFPMILSAEALETAWTPSGDAFDAEGIVYDTLALLQIAAWRWQGDYLLRHPDRHSEFEIDPNATLLHLYYRPVHPTPYDTPLQGPPKLNIAHPNAILQQQKVIVMFFVSSKGGAGRGVRIIISGDALKNIVLDTVDVHGHRLDYAVPQDTIIIEQPEREIIAGIDEVAIRELPHYLRDFEREAQSNQLVHVRLEATVRVRDTRSQLLITIAPLDHPAGSTTTTITLTT
jgi:hypothetical protein